MNESRYYERMASSIGDKARLLEFLPRVTADYAPSVLDVGIGGGELVDVLVDKGYRVTANDKDPEPLISLGLRHFDVETFLGRAEDVDQIGHSFDAVICSAVLHEVYSYGEGLISVFKALEAFSKLLRPGGILIIRDGVKPTMWDEVGYVKILNGRSEPVTKYLEINPFPSIRLYRVKDDLWAGNYQSLMEFAFTYNWGMENYHREARELYGIMRLDQYADIASHFDFKCVWRESYVQPGYVKGLADKVRLLDKNFRPISMFRTNAVWVFRKDG
jgi:SAM-dependent methyltransferase